MNTATTGMRVGLCLTCSNKTDMKIDVGDNVYKENDAMSSDSMNCYKCGALNEETAKFCNSCGNQLDKLIELITGCCYEVVVTRIVPYGALVEIAPGKEGLVHISKLDNKKIKK